MKKQNKDWEEDIKILGMMRLDDDNFRLYEVKKLIKFVRVLIKEKEKEAKIKLLKRIIRNLEARREWSAFNKYFLRDRFLEYLNQAMKEILRKK